MGSWNLPYYRVQGGCVDVSYTVIGMIDNNTFYVDDGQGGVIVVDPSENAPALLEAVGQRHVSAIFVTHHHHDHIGALADMKRATGAFVYASAADKDRIEHPQRSMFGSPVEGCVVDCALADGDKVQVGNTTWSCILAPGHTPGCMCFYIEPANGTNPQGAGVLLSGDVLFCAGIGRTDFEGGDYAQMRRSLRKLAQLPDECIVCPGHNEMTTIGAERRRTIEALM